MKLLKLPLVVLVYVFLRMALAVEYTLRRLGRGFLRPFSELKWGPALLCCLALFALLPWSVLALWLLGGKTRSEFYLPALARINQCARRDLRN